MQLSDQLARGVAALRSGRATEAIPDLATVAESPELATSPELQDVRAAALSLLAQALLESGDPEAAEKPCRTAVGIVRRLGEVEALAEVRSLQDRIVKAIAERREQAEREAEAAHIARTSLADLLADATTPSARASIMVRKATAMLDGGEDADEAADLAFHALDVARAAGDVTWEVFARIALARCNDVHAESHLRAAMRVATDAGEFNLVSTLVRTAELVGLDLPTEVGPHHGQED